MNKELKTFYERTMVERAITPLVGHKMRRRREFVEYVEEYQKLNNRQWYRKRQLQELIAINASYVLEDVKKNIIPGVIKFRKYKGLKSRATAFGRKG